MDVRLFLFDAGLKVSSLWLEAASFDVMSPSLFRLREIRAVIIIIRDKMM